MPDVSNDDDIFENEEDAISYALLEADIGDHLRMCRGLPHCDGTPGEGRIVDGELTYGCPFCHCHVKRGDETIYEMMADIDNVTVH